MILVDSRSNPIYSSSQRQTKGVSMVVVKVDEVGCRRLSGSTMPLHFLVTQRLVHATIPLCIVRDEC
jgi:aromatic ring-opening dioxygenase LigB subunit